MTDFRLRTATISAEDRAHINDLLKWSAQAAERGDMESSDRLLDAANRVLNRAHCDAQKQA